MKKTRVILQYFLALFVIGSVGLIWAPATHADQIEDIYNKAKASGANLPWNSASEFEAQIVSPCYDNIKSRGSQYSNRTEADCANLAISCVSYVTTQSRCKEPDSMADAATETKTGGNGIVGTTMQCSGLGAQNECFQRWNQQARQDRWNDQYSSLVDNLCAGNASKMTVDQARNCKDDGRKIYDQCYDEIAKTDPTVPASKLRDCFNQKLKAKNGIDASDPNTPGNSTSTQDPANKNSGNGSGNGNNTDKKNTCQVQKVGWLVCSVTEFLANWTDKIYDNGLKPLLNVPPINISADKSNDLYTAWEFMRNIANVAFVAVFLIIIYSQITNMGINNYGIKRMLPRLIIAAILVNVSYYICALAVDLSNILGAALKDGLTNLNTEGASGLTFDIDDKGFTAQGHGWVTLTLAILASAAVVYLGLSILLPALITVILSILTVIIALTLRQALIILLIVISPLAFVAYLLPNTESLFKKWLELFKTLLLLYPIIALMFGAAGLAGTIIMQSSKVMLVQIMGAVSEVVILLLVPVVMRSAGGILNRAGAWVNNPNKGPADRARKGAENLRKREESRRAIASLSGKTFGAANVMSGGKYRRQARRQAVDAGVAAELNRSQQQYTAQSIQNSPGFANKVAGGGYFNPADASAVQRALERAKFTIDKADLEEVQAARLQIESANFAQTQGMLPGNGEVSQATAQEKAAIQKTVESMDIQGIDHLINSSSNWGDSEAAKALRKTLADALSKSRPGYVGQGDIAQIRSGENTGAEDMRINAINKGAYSMEKIAGADPDELQAMYNTATSAAGQAAPGQAAFIQNAKDVQSHQTLGAKLGKNANVVRNIGNIAPPNSGPQPPAPPTP